LKPTADVNCEGGKKRNQLLTKIHTLRHHHKGWLCGQMTGVQLLL